MINRIGYAVKTMTLKEWSAVAAVAVGKHVFAKTWYGMV